MTEQQRPAEIDLRAENEVLRAQLAQRESEIAILRKRKEPRRLDAGAADKFQRPFAQRNR